MSAGGWASFPCMFFAAGIMRLYEAYGSDLHGSAFQVHAECRWGV